MLRNIKNVLTDDRGQGLAEYALILGLVAVAAVTVLGALSTSIKGSLGSAATAI